MLAQTQLQAHLYKAFIMKLVTFLFEDRNIHTTMKFNRKLASEVGKAHPTEYDI